MSENPNADATKTSVVEREHDIPVSNILSSDAGVTDEISSEPISTINSGKSSDHEVINLISDSDSSSSMSDSEMTPSDDTSQSTHLCPSPEEPLVDLTEADIFEMADIDSFGSVSGLDSANISERSRMDFTSDEEEFFRKDEKIELVGFDLKPYTLTDSERFGNCRLISDFKKLSYVGEGAYGIVYKVLDKKYGTIAALKKMKISLKDREPLTPRVIREINILKHLAHPNIVNSRGVAVGRNFNCTYLVLDYCDYDLSKVIDDEKTSGMIEEPQIKCIMLQLLEGLKYIHKHCVLHRDISCSNLLFTAEGILKISDFGLSRLMDSEKAMTPDVVSRWYRAPEILLGATYYSFAIDVWSAGCIFAELIKKKPLFMGDSDMKLITKITDLLGTPTEAIWPGLSKLPVMETYELQTQPENNLKTVFAEQSEECLDLLSKLFTYDPKERICATTASCHPYFSKDPQTCLPEDLACILKSTEEQSK